MHCTKFIEQYHTRVHCNNNDSQRRHHSQGLMHTILADWLMYSKFQTRETYQVEVFFLNLVTCSLMQHNSSKDRIISIYKQVTYMLQNTHTRDEHKNCVYKYNKYCHI